MSQTFLSVPIKFKSDKELFDLYLDRNSSGINPSPVQKEALKKIKREIKKELTVFYQNPYPYNVPNFNNNLTVIRFGYDNGCLLDRMCVSQPKVDTTNLEEGSHYYLISKNKTIYIK